MAAAILGSLGSSAWADELVTLRNGFEMHCDHHAEIEGHVRLYPSTGEDNYIQFLPQEIAGVEYVADPPPATGDQATKSLIPANPVVSAKVMGAEAKLSPADLREMLAKAGGEHNLDVDLLASVVKAESGGNARALSRAGARGLMQLMPGTASELGVQDSFKPEQNVRAGSAYLDALLVRYHDKLALALAAYNAGPAAVDKYHGIPPYHETQAYVARVIHEFNRRVLARAALARQTVASIGAHPGSGTR
jgi:soluble lytic murein transglycosylase-like protein